MQWYKIEPPCSVWHVPIGYDFTQNIPLVTTEHHKIIAGWYFHDAMIDITVDWKWDMRWYYVVLPDGIPHGYTGFLIARSDVLEVDSPLDN